MAFRADKSNVPSEMLRWSLFKASREFGTAEITLGKKLGEAGEVAGPDECFSTRQILRGLYGEVYAERLRKTKEEADMVGLKNAAMRGDFLSRFELQNLFGQIAHAILEIIKSSGLTKEEQNDVRRQIASIPVVLRQTAKAQSKGTLNGAEKKKQGRPPKPKPDEKTA